MDALHDLLEMTDATALAAQVRAVIRERPLAILEIATAMSTARYGWPADAVTKACREQVGLLADLHTNDVRDELTRCLCGRDVDLALQWLLDIGVIGLFFKELAATVDLAQEGGRHHKDVWEHTKLVVKQAVNRPAVRWAALLHDIGKVPTRTFTNSGVHFHGHAEVGARMFDRLARRFPFEGADRKKIRFLIKYHLRSNQYGATWSDSAVRRFSRDMEAHLTDLLDLSRADITSKRPGRRQALLRQISELAARVVELREQDAKLPPLNPGVGTAIMTAFGLPPGRRIGELKRALEAAIANGELEERREDSYYTDWLEKTGLVGDPGLSA